MDDLDRMLRRLVQNIRTGYPEYLTHAFEVSELYQNLIPYRHNRREMEIETNEGYEIALCRLLSGERGYMVVDEALAEAMRRELATSNPNTAIFREFAASRVSISPAAQRGVAELGSELGGADVVLGAAPGRTPTASSAPSPPWLSRPAGAGGVAAAPATAAPPVAASAPPAADETSCRYCGGSLPPGRRAAFCPHCGQNLKTQRCPACGTELELLWKYCITCGRGIAAR